MNALQFRISQLRVKNQQVVIEGIMVLIAALFVSALLPSLMVRYVYASQNLTAEPALLGAIPTAAFVIGMLYFFYSMVMVMMREKKAMLLEKEMTAMMPALANTSLPEAELAELESIVDKALAQKGGKKSTVKRARAKKAAK